MSLWRTQPNIEQLNALQKNTIGEVLDIRFESFDEESLTASMVVDQRTHQPYGLLHGGASVVLAETLASWAATFVVDRERFHCVGMEINANHLRPVADGWVRGEARPINLGRTTQVWDIRITNADGKLVCISRCTMAVLPIPSQY